MIEISDSTCFGDLWRILSEHGATLQHVRNLPRGWTVEIRAPRKGIFEVTDSPSLVEALTSCLNKVESAPVRFRSVPPPPVARPLAKASIDELISRSSLGTPEARAVAATVDEATVQKCLRRADELDSRKLTALNECIDADDAKARKTMASVFVTHKKVIGDFAISRDGVRSKCSSIRGETAGSYTEDWTQVTCKRCLRSRHD